MSTLTVQHAKNDTIADWSGVATVGNSTGGTTTVNASDLVRPSDWNSTHNFTLNIFDTDLPDIEFYEIFNMAATATALVSVSNGSWYLDPFFLPKWIESGYFMMPQANVTSASRFFQNQTSFLGSTATGVMSLGMSFYDRLALYKPGDGTAASVLNSIWSGNCDIFMTMSISVTNTTSNLSTITVNAYGTVQMPYQWDNSGNVSTSNFTGSSQFTTNGSSMVSSAISPGFTTLAGLLSGSAVKFYPFASTLAAGAYVIGHMISTSTASGSTGGQNYAGSQSIFMSSQSVLELSNANFQAYKQVGKSTTNANSGMIPFEGFWTGASSLPPSTIGTNEVSYTTGRFYIAKDERSRG